MFPRFPSVCVYCGSRFGARAEYREDAASLGRSLAQAGWRLVYGAGDVGLMGAVANAAQTAGGATLGVIPQHLLAREVGKRDLTQFVVTENMHERKKVMFVNSNATVVLPGGAGSLDEFFEVLTWAQLGLHRKPIVLLNTEGYWAPLIKLIDHVINEGFAEQTLAEFITVAETVPEAMSILKGQLRQPV